MNRLGAHERPGPQIELGILLPKIGSECEVLVRAKHEKDLLIDHIRPVEVPLVHSIDATHGDYWSGSIDIPAVAKPSLDSAWGAAGTYAYWYVVRDRAGRCADYVVDPFAREFSLGRISAITVGFKDHEWSVAESNWQVPDVEDLVIYELMIHEFGGGIDGTIDKLDYLRDLGINCIELMPVTNVEMTSDWGYAPIGYFGVEERFGNRATMQRLVDEAHQRGIAVIVDAVYAHTSEQFCYAHVYRALGITENPFCGPFAQDAFGVSVDYDRPLAQDYFLSVNEHWLEKFHIDGFRYDYVPGFYVKPDDTGYAKLVYDTYQLAKNRPTTWPRFHVGDRVNLIQIGEQLEAPAAILRDTYSTGTWQRATQDTARRLARTAPGALREPITELGMQLVALGYETQKSVNGDLIHQRPVQYIETHDDSRFIAEFGCEPTQTPLLMRGDRSRAENVRPYLIALLLSKGTPMLWQGEELVENYTVPSASPGRNDVERPVHWDYYFDDAGAKTAGLVRTLLGIRRAHPAFTSESLRFTNDPGNYQDKGLLALEATRGDDVGLVLVNFTDHDVDTWLKFPARGRYADAIHDHASTEVTTTTADEWRPVHVPRHDGQVWIRTA
jgi:1,4-alpha-glucan branching enzyme